MDKGKAVLVTTVHRGVIFGYADGKVSDDDVITLRDARMCVRWSRAMRGVFGLAVLGPDENCRIGYAVPEAEVRGVTAVVRMTPQAVERWEAAPWQE